MLKKGKIVYDPPISYPKAVICIFHRDIIYLIQQNNKEITDMKNKKDNLYRIVAVALMAALVYVGNYMQIKIPNGGLVTRIHLGNSMCLLAGLLFGGISGGLSSGIGAAMYDLFDPVYITSAPITFINKFAMGFTAGILRKKGKKWVIPAAVAGQAVYILLYLGKSFIGLLITGEPVVVALQMVSVNAVASVINGVLAVLIAVPLYSAIAAALKHTGFGRLISYDNETPEDTQHIIPA